MEWNRAQQSAIFERNKNILVSAAAGSGKTAVLVERIKRLIVDEEADIGRMLIVTFTNAAAGEMRERITKAINEAVNDGDSCKASSPKAVFLRGQIKKIQGAQISTFHSFCMEVIRRYFYLLDIKPDVKICDETGESILQHEAMQTLFERRFESGDEEFIEFLHKYAGSRNEDRVKTMIGMVYRFIMSVPQPLSWLEEEIEALKSGEQEVKEREIYRYAMKLIDEELERALGYFSRVLSIADDAGIPGITAKALNDLTRLNRLIDLLKQDEKEGFQNAMNGLKFEVFSARGEEKEAFLQVKEEIKFLRDRGKAVLKNAREKYAYFSAKDIVGESHLIYKDARYLYELVGQFIEIYRACKEEKSVIDFNDAEHLALSILSNEEAAGEYKERFDHIFIDEYQDSNVIQEALIDRIKRDDNLFMVGDVKQSIYKFRLAQPEIFMDKYERYKSGVDMDSMKIDLNENFRSKSGVIDFTNMIFEKIMSRSTCGMEYDADARLYKGLSYDGELSWPTEVYVVDESVGEVPDEIDDEIKEMKKTELEAAAAARIVKETFDTYIYDDKRECKRRVSYRDMVILFRALRGPKDIYHEIFARENIPIYAQLDDGYFDTVEIGTFLNLLRIIDNRRQDIPLLSVLRSAIGGFSTDELIKIRLSKKNVPFSEAFLSCDIDKCRAFTDKLMKWRELSATMPLEAFLWELMLKSGYYEYVGAMPGGRQRKANLRVLTDKATSFQSAQGSGVFEFINYVEQLKKTGTGMGQTSLIGENDDVVRLMTVHKSKGLEFPVVIVAGLGKRFNMRRESYQVSLHRDMGFSMRYVRKEDFAGSKTFAQEIIEVREKRESLAEEMRILYVAFTRARDRLILLGTLKDVQDSLSRYELKANLEMTAANCYWDWIIPAMQSAGIRPIVIRREDMSLHKAESERNSEQIKEGIINGFIAKDSEREQEMQARLSWSYPYKEASKMPSKYAASEVAEITEKKLSYNIPELQIPADLSGAKGGLSAAEKGTAVHKVMGYLDLKAPMSVKSVESRIELMVQKEILTEQEASSVDAVKICGFFESDIGKRIRAAGKVQREKSFILKIQDESPINDIHSTGNDALIQGAIDCYFEENGKVILVDYKTDRIFTNSDMDFLVERYRPQLSVYKKALEQIKGAEVSEVYLYFFDTGKTIPVNV